MVDTTADFHKIVNPKDYPKLSRYTHPVLRAQRKIIGRENEMRKILATFERPELSNVLLLANGGGGKTALVQGLMRKDKKRIYLEVQLSKMIADAGDNPDRIAEWLRNIFNESAKYGKQNKYGVVLFIDEFHQIVTESAAAVEVLKPLLADSGTRGIHFIAATTYDEYQEHVSKNQPLIERLEQTRLPQPAKETVVQILKNMATRYDVVDQIPDDRLYNLIYEYTNRYIPSQIQPRKSILVLDKMIGYWRSEGEKLNLDSLARVLYDQQGINVTFKADINKIQTVLEQNILQQPNAIAAIVSRLQICIADLNDKTKPMSSFLFTGSTGVGKTETAKQLAILLFNDSQSLIRFDMSEYAEENSFSLFKNELTQQVWAHPYCILLLDEIEKAAKPIIRLLLQVLDDGRLSDVNNRTVSFVNTYIIMTTNAAHEIYKQIGKYQDQIKDTHQYLREYEGLIRQDIQQSSNKFPPELLGRIDQIVPFQPLIESTQRSIAQNLLSNLLIQLKNRHHVIGVLDKSVIDYLIGDAVTQSDSDAGGAREIIHKMQTEIVAPIAAFINTYPQVHHILITTEGLIAAKSKYHRISTAEVKVYAVTNKKKQTATQPA